MKQAAARSYGVWLAMFAGAASTALAGNIRLRLATAWSDDTPVVFANYLNHPAFWRGDDLVTYGQPYAYGTILNWGVALLERHLHIAPEFSAIVLTYLQNVLFAAAVYAYARALLRDTRIALVTTMFALAAQPWVWNLALYQPATETPYAGHFVLALVLLALAAFVNYRIATSALLLMAAAFVHPAIALAGVTIAGVSAVWTDGDERRRQFVWYLPPLICAVALPLLLRATAAEPLAGNDLVAVLRANAHMYPFVHSELWRERLPAFAGFIILAWLSTARMHVIEPRARKLLLAGSVVTALWTLGHIVAWVLQSPILIQLNGHRTTILAVLLWLPLIIDYLIHAVEEQAWPARIAAALVLALQAVFTWGLYVGALGALVIERLAPRRRASGMILVAWGGLVAAAGIAGVASAATTARPLLAVLVPGVYFDVRMFITALAIAGVLVAMRQYRSTVVAVLAIALVLRSVQRSQELVERTAADVYGVQMWAHTATPADAMFIIEPPISWRTYSLRRAVLIAGPRFEVYSRSRASLTRHDSVAAFVRAHRMDSQTDWRAFANQFGGDYVVRRRDAAALSKQVYANQTFAVYRLR